MDGALTVDGVAALKLVQLRKELEDRGIDAVGSKQELVRLGGGRPLHSSFSHWHRLARRRSTG